MVLARIAESHASDTPRSIVDEINVAQPHGDQGLAGDGAVAKKDNLDDGDDDDLGEGRPPYPHAILSGGLGGLTGDMLMHSLDTVKTRQQGDPHRPPKYHSLGHTYTTIFKQEGVRRGLYGGVLPAFVGSFGGTSIFFGSYEWSKRVMVDNGITPSVAYFTAGLVADLIASPLYVPTEVLKTRLQLQGRYKNPFFQSGYNYRSTWHALRTIIKTEGYAALFHGYKATLYRDLPFSALQFAFYEKEREFAKYWVGSKQIGLPLEVLTGATAGGLAGVITCPLDVVKTRVQTQQQGAPSSTSGPSQHGTPSSRPSASSDPVSVQQRRTIFTHAPSKVNIDSGRLDTSSVMRGLQMIYRSEGFGGLYRGVGPRGVWTAIQSGVMLPGYQKLLEIFDEYWPLE